MAVSKRLVFGFRIALLVSMCGSPFFSAAVFFFVQDVILRYPTDLRYPYLWGTVAALCVLILPIVFAELLALSITTNLQRIKTLTKLLEVTCWLGATGVLVVPMAFCVMQDIGHIVIILFQVTTASIFASAALFTRICRQSDNRSLLVAQN